MVELQKNLMPKFNLKMHLSVYDERKYHHLSNEILVILNYLIKNWNT